MIEDLSILTRKGIPPDLTLAYGSDPDQVADVRYGQRGSHLPLVVLIHGGFWKPQYDREHTEAMASALAAAGWTVLTLEYRRIPGQPDCTLQDIATALEKLPAMVEQHNGKVLLVGHSAGGHLALWAAVKCRTQTSAGNPKHALSAVLAIAPAADLRLAHALHLGDGAVSAFLGADPVARPDVDPLQMPAPTLPVTVLQGGADAIVPPSVASTYCAAFPKTRLVTLPECGHFALIDPASSAWPTLLTELSKLSTESAHASAPPLPSQPHPLRSLLANLKTGLRVTFFQRPTPNALDINWSQLIILTLLHVVIQFALDFSSVGINGQFSLYGLPGVLFVLPLMLFAAWAMARLVHQSEKTLLLLLVFSAASLFNEMLHIALQWILHHKLIRHLFPQWGDFGDHFLIGWLALACGLAAIRLTSTGRIKKLLISVFAAGFIAVPLLNMYIDRTLWFVPYDKKEAEDASRQRHLLESEDVFYSQPKILEKELLAIRPSSGNASNLFFVGFAGYSDQDVFMKEIHFVSDLFKKRFATTGHSVALINNAKTLTQSPIASATSLKLALKQVGLMMDTNKDILFLYMSSHGSADHKFSLDFGSMRFNDLDPGRLRKILDESGIQHRVIVISACYSGGFINALKNENTLVITAAASDKTSFGCSNEADFTYFGKAYFDQALSKTDSFIDAFDLAKPIIAAREKEDDYTPSDPRIFVGEKIKLLLTKFTQQLSAARMLQTTALNSANLPAVQGNPIGDATVVPKGEINEGNEHNNKAAHTLIGLMQYDVMLQEGIKQCKEAVKASGPDSIYKATPNYFGGISPQSPLWPKVIEVYRLYNETACDYANSEANLIDMEKVYSSRLKADELAELIKFYSSPLGKKFAVTNSLASIALSKEMSSQATALHEKANTRFIKEISALIAIDRKTKAAEVQRNKPWWRFW